MITKRIIPCLDVKNGRVVKGVNFEGLSDVSSPVELAKYYSDKGADELVFYDITASVEERKLFTDILGEVAGSIFIPLTVGGGINGTDDFDRVLKCGADKVSVNSGAIRNPQLIEEAAASPSAPSRRSSPSCHDGSPLQSVSQGEAVSSTRRISAPSAARSSSML